MHDNDGVGNKTAYLISQGGTFNGRTIAGIDSGDPGLAKTGRLYLDVIARLTSGAEYADLGRVLVSTCAEFVDRGLAGFTQDELHLGELGRRRHGALLRPGEAAAAAREAPVRCPTVTSVNTLLKRDDDGIDGSVSARPRRCGPGHPTATSRRTPPAARSPSSERTRTRASARPPGR